jgi:hypothetical protein
MSGLGQSAVIKMATFSITGSKKQNDEVRGAALFAVRVHAIVMCISFRHVLNGDLF